MQRSFVDKLFLLLWPLCASILCVFAQIPALISIFVYYLIPSLYLSYKLPKRIGKVFLFSSAGALVWICFDYIWELTGAWQINSIFSTKLLGQISIESILWIFFWIYWILMTYEYFWENNTIHEKTKRPTYYLFAGGSFLLGTLFIITEHTELSLYLPYSYFILGTIAVIIPALVILITQPLLRKKLSLAGLYFFYATILYEATAVTLNYWWYPEFAQYLYRVPIFEYQVPIEEIVVWIIFGSITVLGLYETLDDDGK